MATYRDCDPQTDEYNTQASTSDTERQREYHRTASPSKVPALSHDAYTIAWICALHLELAASRCMIDEEHAPLAAKDGDQNIYVLGRIASHNVVMTALPVVYGKVNAAAVATHLKRSFPNIRATVMVGIGGAAPSEADLYLGDLVVGTRVMEYDLGKATANGSFDITAIPKHPSPLLLNAVTNLRSKYGPNQWSSRSQHLLQTRLSNYPRPAQPDLLFQASYRHPADADPGTCRDCDAEKLQTRRCRVTNDFFIHYGGIASGDSVFKDASKRDALARRLDIKCFEMESAGIMDSLECLPIRGICDYSDSHKNKDWQGYAAATAASYARELLETIPSLASAAGLVPSDIWKAARDNASSSLDDMLEEQRKAQMKQLEERRKARMELLDFTQINARRDAIQTEQVKTCRWMLEHEKYLDWVGGDKEGQHRSSILWIRGKAGAGKSTIMKFLFSNRKVKATTSWKLPQTLIVSFFFNARGEHLEKSIEGLYRSLLQQVLTLRKDLQWILDASGAFQPGTQTRPSLNWLKDMLGEAVMNLGATELICFIDALDECDEHDAREMVLYFEDLTEAASGKNISFRVAFSSRPYPYIQVNQMLLVTIENERGHAKDLAQYIDRRLRVPPRVKEELSSQILAKASGVFMWVVLVVGILNKEASHGGLALGRRLLEIPPTLSQLFKEILLRDQERPDQLRRCILWVLCARRPLHPDELRHALWAGGLDDDQVDDEVPVAEDQESNMALVIGSSKGLVEITIVDGQLGVAQFIHESVRDFLIKERGLQELWPELGFDWEGPSHEILRKCCESYLTHSVIFAAMQRVLIARLGSPSHDQVSWDSHATRVSRRDRTEMDVPNFTGATEKVDLEAYRLTEYAITSILYHANIAAPSIPQGRFLRRFLNDFGVAALDFFQRGRGDRYGPKTCPLYMLADQGLGNLIRLNATDIDINDQDARFPLFAALSNRHRDAVAALLHLPTTIYEDEDLMDRSKHVTREDFASRTPMTWAAQEGHINLIRVLIGNGVSITENDPAGFSPLKMAARCGQLGAVQLLLDHGVSTADEDYRMSIHEALIYSQDLIAAKLLQNFSGWRSLRPWSLITSIDYWLHMTAWNGMDGAARLLMQHGATYSGAIVTAAIGNHFDVLQTLVHGGVDVNQRGTGGRTALMVASSCDRRAMARFLVDQGADTELRCDEGLTAFQHAKQFDRVEIALMLQSLPVRPEPNNNSRRAYLRKAFSGLFFSKSRKLDVRGHVR
ncbi:ankyrin repeat domain-containing protein 50 [Microdochium nivale]|nr:ankyrin repeat domain-containing protein 50 [Microdochium nivale]